MYADKITPSMQLTIDETSRRREKQLRYNEQHGIVPTQIVKERTSALSSSHSGGGQAAPKSYVEPAEAVGLAAEPVVKYMSRTELERAVANAKRLMERAAKELDFVQAAQHRDEMQALQKMLEAYGEQ